MNATASVKPGRDQDLSHANRCVDCDGIVSADLVRCFPCATAKAKAVDGGAALVFAFLAAV